MRLRVCAVLLVLFVSGGILAGCGVNGTPTAFAGGDASAYRENTQQTATELNEASDFGGYALLQPSSNGLPFNPQQPETVSIVDEVAEGYFTPYPATSSDCFLTHIYLRGIGCQVFGLAPGDNMDKARTVMEENGYVKQELKGDYSHYDRSDIGVELYAKYDVSILFYALPDSGFIVEIGIFVQDTTSAAENT